MDSQEISADDCIKLQKRRYVRLVIKTVESINQWVEAVNNIELELVENFSSLFLIILKPCGCILGGIIWTFRRMDPLEINDGSLEVDDNYKK